MLQIIFVKLGKHTQETLWAIQGWILDHQFVLSGGAKLQGIYLEIHEVAIHECTESIIYALS